MCVLGTVAYHGAKGRTAAGKVVFFLGGGVFCVFPSLWVGNIFSTLGRRETTYSGSVLGNKRLNYATDWVYGASKHIFMDS